jgi:hypothetical protein
MSNIYKSNKKQITRRKKSKSKSNKGTRRARKNIKQQTILRVNKKKDSMYNSISNSSSETFLTM